MKKSFIIAAFAALAFTACNNSEKSSSDNSNSEQELTAPAVNQDSIDKAHGHSTTLRVIIHLLTAQINLLRSLKLIRTA